MVKFSTWQMAFCLFSLCILQVGQVFGSDEGGGNGEKDLGNLRKDNLIKIKKLLNLLITDLKATIGWRNIRNANKDQIKECLEDYKLRIQRIGFILDGQNNKPKKQEGLVQKGKKYVKSTGNNITTSAKAFGTKFISVTGYLSKKFTGTNNLSAGLQEILNIIESMEIIIADTPNFKRALGEAYSKIEALINSSETWYELADLKDNKK